MTIGAMPRRNPAHGVIATSPATQPDAAPSVVGWPCVSHSTSSQLSIAAAAAMCVLMKRGGGEAVARRAPSRR